MPNHWSDQHLVSILHISDCWSLRGRESSVQSHLADSHTWCTLPEGHRYTGVGTGVLYDAAQYFSPQYGVRTEWTLHIWCKKQWYKKIPTLRAVGENL